MNLSIFSYVCWTFEFHPLRHAHFLTVVELLALIIDAEHYFSINCKACKYFLTFIRVLLPTECYPTGCLLTLLEVSFAEQFFLAWCNAICLFFVLIPAASGVLSKKPAYSYVLQSVLIFSSNNLMVSGHRSRSLIHLDVIFLYHGR